MKKIKRHLDKIFISGLALVLPMTTFAQSSSCLADFKKEGTLGALFEYLICLAQSSIVPLLFVVAMVAFIWGVVQFVAGADNEEKREKGRQFMIWGIVGLAVMVSVWGLVSIFTKSFGIDNNIKAPTLPKLPT